MARITEIFILETPKQDILSIHNKVEIAKLPKYIESGFQQLEEYLAKQHLIAADVPGMQILGVDGTQMEVSIAVAIHAANEGNDIIRRECIPEGKKAMCYYQGDTNQGEVIVNEMVDYVMHKGYQVESIWEYYVNDIQHGENQLLTKVVLVLY